MARGGQRGRMVSKAVTWSASLAGRLAERRRAAVEERTGSLAVRPEVVLEPQPLPVPQAVPTPQPAAADAEPPHREQPRPRDPHPGRPASPAEAVPWGLRVAAESTWRLLLLGAALYVIFYVVDMLRLVAFALLAGVLISALLEPTVSWLKRHGVPRSLAATVTFLTGLAGICLVGWFVFWQVSTNITEVSNQASNGVQTLHNWLLKGPMHLTPSS